MFPPTIGFCWSQEEGQSVCFVCLFVKIQISFCEAAAIHPGLFIFSSSTGTRVQCVETTPEVHLLQRETLSHRWDSLNLISTKCVPGCCLLASATMEGNLEPEIVLNQCFCGSICRPTIRVLCIQRSHCTHQLVVI